MANSSIYSLRYEYWGQKASVNAFQTLCTARLYIDPPLPPLHPPLPTVELGYDVHSQE